MASLIDPNVPITGNPTTLSVRQNFATAKAEIEALQLSDIVTLTGDITGSGSGTVPTTLPIVNNNVGTFQGIQINAKGQVTGATNQSYLTTNQAITISGDATGTGTTAIPITLASTAVAPGSYTNTSLTVDQKGRITAASNGALGLTGVTAGNGLTGGGTTGNVTISLTTPVSVPNGGLGVSSLTANALLVGTGASPVHPSLIASDDGVSFKISSNIIVGSASGGASGAMGPGTLNVAGGYYVNGVAIGGTAVAVSDTPPATPAQGNQWWDSVGGQLYVYVNDGTSSQWVAATNVPLAPNVTMPLTANAVLVGNGSNPVVASAITSDNGATLRVSTNQVIGNAVTSPPSHSLVINNAASTPQATAIVPQAWLASEAGNTPLLLDYYATAGGQGILIGRRSRGTAAAPTAVQTSDNLVSLVGVGRGATGYSGLSGARLDLYATENWSDTAQGTGAQIITTTSGTTTPIGRFLVRQGVVIGNGAPDPGQGGLVLNANAAVPPATAAGTVGQIVGPDGTTTRLYFDSFAAASSINMRRANGTGAAPSALNTNDLIAAINAFGYGASAYGNAAGGIGIAAAQPWTNTAQGTLINFSTTLNGTTTVAEAMRIDHTGNVGIGTTAPTEKLQISGALKVTGALTTNTASSVGLEQTSGVLSRMIVWGADVNTQGTFQILQQSSTAAHQNIPFHIDNNGNVGIGTTAPGSKLDVRGVPASTYAISATASTTIGGSQGLLLTAGTNSSDYAVAVNNSANTANFFVVRGDGNVGIGTAAPTEKLSVSGQAAAGLNVSAVRSGPNGADATTSLINFQSFDKSVTIGGIVRSGTNQVSYITTSDERLKDGIKASERGLDALMALKVSDYKMGETASQGLLAQDVAKVYPEAVHEGGEDPKTEPWMIDYGRLTPLIIKAVQDLAAEVKALAPPPARKARAE